MKSMVIWILTVVFEQENKRLGSWLQTNIKEEEEKLSGEEKLNQKVTFHTEDCVHWCVAVHPGHVGVAHKGGSVECWEAIFDQHLDQLQHIGGQVQVIRSLLTYPWSSESKVWSGGCPYDMSSLLEICWGLINICAQGKGENRADQIYSDHRQQFGGGGDWGEAGAGGPHCLTHLYTAGILQEFDWLFWSLELGYKSGFQCGKMWSKVGCLSKEPKIVQ